MITTALIAASMLAATSDDWQTRPSIWLDIDPRPVLTAEAGPTSYLGGAPYLPEDVAWPHRPDGTPYNFIAQINLAERPRLDDDPLPQSGLLLVFGHFFDGYAYPHLVHVEQTEGLEPQIANAPRTFHSDFDQFDLLDGETPFDLAYPIVMYEDTSLDEWSGPPGDERYDQLFAFEDARPARRASMVAERFGLNVAQLESDGELQAPSRADYVPRTAMDIYRAGIALETRLAGLSCGLDPTAGTSRPVMDAITEYRVQASSIAEQWSAFDPDWRALAPEETERATQTWSELDEANRTLSWVLLLDARDAGRVTSIDPQCNRFIALGMTPVLNIKIIPTNMRYALVQGVPVDSLYPSEQVDAIIPDLEARQNIPWYYANTAQMLGYATSRQTASQDNRDNVLVLQLSAMDHPTIDYLGPSDCIFHIWMTPEAVEARQFETAFATWECT